MSARGHSSLSTPSSPTISASNHPSCWAAMARWWLSRAKRSMSSRSNPHCRAIISAARNCDISWVPYRLRQPGDPLNGSVAPYFSPAEKPLVSGYWLMFCTPPATTRPQVPLRTACAAKCTACCDEPHCRSTVTPGTVSGRPATRAQVRAMSPAWAPMVSAQPKMTSSMAAGSTPVRSTSERMTCAPRSAGCVLARPPRRRPTGVRIASTRKASAMVAPSPDGTEC